MEQSDSSAEVSLLTVDGIPTLKLVAADPDGIKKITIWSRWGKVPIIRNYDCLKVLEDSVAPYPIEWFPIIIDITNCHNERISRLGPFNPDGNEAAGIVESEDTTKSPGSYRQI